MKDEISSALDFLGEKLRNALEEGQLNTFRNNLLEAMLVRFQNHWHPEKPIKGNAFRCLNVEEGKLDPFLKDVVLKSGLSPKDFAKAFPHGLALWIDPNDVSYRLGKGAISPVYRRFDKPSPKLTSLNVNSPSFTPRVEVKGRLTTTTTSFSGNQARFSPPPGFSHAQNADNGRFSPPRISEINNDFSSSWSTVTVPSNTWSERKSMYDAFGDSDTRFSSQDRSIGFQNFPQSNGWKANRKGRPNWNFSSSTSQSLKADRFNRFHWYKDDQLSSVYDKQHFEFKGIPQEVY